MTPAPVTLELEHANAILDALLIGLASYGEIERLDDAYDRLRIGPINPAAELRPIHPTGSADTVSDFAAAIFFLHGAMRRAKA
jgi:LDH2 family malate/lactate/ureidoglycolate dehydrogenase